MPSRRDFLAAGAAGLMGVRGAVPAPGRSPTSLLERMAALGEEPPPRHPLSILILGGTSFLGPHQIAYALGRGHTVTTFTRGRTEPTVHRRLFRDVEALTGDRAGDLDALRGRGWDAVIDNSGREIAWTRAAAELLEGTVDLYVYTSSTGVYYPYLGDHISEETPPALALPEGVDPGENGAHDYGVMKAASERAAIDVFGGERTVVVRPTYMMGPGDPTDRFTYWPVRLALGGEVLVPGRPDDPVQYVDARDVSEWMIRLIEERRAGTFNAVGPASSTGMLRFVHAAHGAFGSAADFVVVDDYDFLEEHGVRFAVPWIMPVGDNYGSARVDNGLGVENGLSFRPLARSVRDTWEWWHGEAVSQERRDRMLSGDRALIAREGDVLRAWRSRG